MVIPPLKHREQAVCPRCGYVLTRFYRHAFVRIVSFSLACLIFLVLSLLFPFLQFNLQGVEITLSLIDILQSYANMEYGIVSFFLIVSAVLIPLAFLACVLYVVFAFSRNKLLPKTLALLKISERLLPWNMAEIFLVAILISFVKVQGMADIYFGYSFFSYVIFINCFIAVIFYYDRYQFWHTLQQKRACQHE
jgi:paraquat-inducible protein A